MNAELHQRQVAYRAAMAMAGDMLAKDIITDTEYHKINRVLAEKYGQIVFDNNARIPLIYTGSRVNMSATEGGNDNENDRKD